MVGINLISSELLTRYTVWRRMRGWVLAAVLILIAVAIPIFIEQEQRVQVERLRVKVTDLDARLRTTRGQVAQTAQAVLDADAELARAHALRTKRSWAGLLDLVSDCMSEEVWLSSLATDPPAPTGAARPQAGREREGATPPGGNRRGTPQTARNRDGTGLQYPGEGPSTESENQDRVVLEAPTRLQLDGFAVDPVGPYELMAKLKESGSFTRVELVRAGMEPVLQGRAVHFVLTCEW